MGNGVHAGCSRHQGWQTEGERWVEQSHFRHQMPGMKTQLAAIVDDDDGASGHFAARAGSGGHSDEGQHFVGDAG